MTGYLAEAQDAVQEAFVRTWQRWPMVYRYHDPESAPRRAGRFRQQARQAGLDTGLGNDAAAIVPIIGGDPATALHLSDGLRQRGVNAPPILFPAVAEQHARVRFFLQGGAHRTPRRRRPGGPHRRTPPDHRQPFDVAPRGPRAKVSKDTVSRISDKVLEKMTEWRNRPLNAVYPVMYVDAAT